MSPDHIHLPCPSCQHPLRVRREYVGKNVICKHCKKPFKVFVPDDREFHPPPDERPSSEGKTPAEHKSDSLSSEVPITREEWEALNRALSEARLQIEHHEADVRRLQKVEADAETTREERDRLIAEVAQLKDELAQHSDDVAPVSPSHEEALALKVELEGVREECAKLRALSAEQSMALTERERSAQDANEQSIRAGADEENAQSPSRFEEELLAERARHAEQTAALERVEQTLAEAKQERDRLQDEVRALKEDLVQATALASDTSSIEAELNATKLELNALREEHAKLGSLESDHTTLREERDRLRDEAEELAERLRSHQEATRRLAGIEEELRTERLRGSAHAAEFEQMETELGLVRDQHDRLRDEVQALQEKLAHAAESESQVDALQSELNGLKLELSGTQEERSRLEELQSEHAALQAERDRLREEARELADRLGAHGEMERRLACVEEELRAERAELVARDAEAERLRGMVEEHRDALSEATQAHETALAALRNEFDQARRTWENERQGNTQSVDELRAEHERQMTHMAERFTNLEEVYHQERALWERREEDFAREREELLHAKAAMEERLQAVEAERVKLLAEQETLSAERKRALQQLFDSQIEHSHAVEELQKKLDEARTRPEDSFVEGHELAQAKANLVMARQKIEELSELLEESEDVRRSMQQTLRALGIRVS